MINIVNINCKKIEFTFSKSLKNVMIKLRSDLNKEVFYETYFEEVVNGVIYWVSHPRFYIENKLYLEVYEENKITYAKLIGEGFFNKDPKHITNLIPDISDNDTIKKYNDSFFEIFINDNFDADENHSYIYNDVKNFIDLGGNCGFFSRKVFNNNKDAKGIIVEPNSNLIEVISETNKNFNYIIKSMAFGINNGDTVSFNIANSFNCTAVSHQANLDIGFTPSVNDFTEHQIETINMEGIMEEFNDDVIVDILKVDIEGGEQHLNSVINQEIIKKRVKYILVETHSDEIENNIKNTFTDTFNILTENKQNRFNHIIFVNKNLNTYYNRQIIHIIESNEGKISFHLTKDCNNVKIVIYRNDNVLGSFKFEEIKKYTTYWISDSYLKIGGEYIVKLYNGDDILDEKIVNISIDKKVLLTVSCPALGDTICSTPTIRKVSKSYGIPIDVMTKRPDVFKNNPYVNNIIPWDDNFNRGQYKETYETYNPTININGKNINIKLSNFEARQLHALGVGVTLYPEELHYDFFADKQTEDSKKVTKNHVVLHITDNWPNRTWPKGNWQRLVDLIKEHTNLEVVTIGKSHTEVTSVGNMKKNVFKLQNIDLDFCDDTVGGQEHQSKYRPISELWHVLNNSLCLISFDSGPVHLAGSTDTEILQIGASIRYEKTAPWRKGSQNYKFKSIGGECSIMCGSDTKYSVREHATINNLPYYPSCLERYDGFPCQPSPDKVFFEVLNLI